ncbi:angiopoietin-related protein 4 [Elysia marginata]|uniref:Angiopoietin-related protein 4 n=1 Tax=Elysia marginata TaxID=1093978 RepID=A0AAV4F4L1_9GAST|nr:angiopoietin-related protein 4 [Elysia marginata]
MTSFLSDPAMDNTVSQPGISHAHQHLCLRGWLGRRQVRENHGSDPALTQIQLKVNANTSFNKTWQDFKNGFDFSPQEDFWLGNEKIHYITASKAHTLVVSVVVDDAVHQLYMYDFFMANETADFAVTYTETFSNSSVESYLGSCWGNDSIKFSTYDLDNDGVMSTNCASEFGAGWWYQAPNCSACNPNGDIDPNQTERLGIPSENFWNAAPINTSSPDLVSMALFRNLS